MKQNKKHAAPKKEQIVTGNLPPGKSFPLAAYYFLLGAACCIAYSGTFQNGFSSYDDPSMILQNADIRQITFESLKAFFSKPYLLHYHPLTMISLAADAAVYGLEPWGFHLTNLLLHILNVLLLFRVVRAFTRNDGISAALALLWAVHPVNAEAVAWATARKDVLFTAFYFGSLLFYLRYLNDTGARKWYWAAAMLFVFSLLSKSAAMSLPFVLLLFDFARKREMNKAAFLEKIPLFLFAAGFGILSVMTQKETVGTAVALGYSFIDRAVLFFYALGFYCVKLIFPSGLSVIHFFPAKQAGFFEAEVYVYAACGALLIPLFIFLFRKQRPAFYMATAFVFTLLPVLQIVPFAQSIVAERFAYVPYAMAAIAAGAYIREKEIQFLIRMPAAAKTAALAAAVVFGVLTFQRVTVWRTGFSLYADALEKNPGNPMALTMCGVAKIEVNDFAGAKKYFKEAVKNDSLDPLALFSLGTANMHLQNFREAEMWFSKVLTMNGSYEDARYNRMLCYNSLGVPDSAMADAGVLIAQHPEKGEYYYARGLLKNDLKDTLGANRDLQKAYSLGWR